MALGNDSLVVISDDPIFTERIRREVVREGYGWRWSGWLPLSAGAAPGSSGVMVVDGGELNEFSASVGSGFYPQDSVFPLFLYAYNGSPPSKLWDGYRGLLSRNSAPEVFLIGAKAVKLGLSVTDVPPDRSPPETLRRKLTPRETEVLRLVARGFPDKGISSQLGISMRTVKFHISEARAKLDAASRAEAVAVAASLGILPL